VPELPAAKPRGIHLELHLQGGTFAVKTSGVWAAW
jgi:hypothetical protein